MRILVMALHVCMLLPTACAFLQQPHSIPLLATNHFALRNNKPRNNIVCSSDRRPCARSMLEMRLENTRHLILPRVVRPKVYGIGLGRQKLTKRSKPLSRSDIYLATLQQLDSNNLTDPLVQDAVLKEVVTTSAKSIISEEFWIDMKRWRMHFRSDWVDGFKKPSQMIPAILFLYFACLAPAVSFGTIASQLTTGSIGVVEFLLSAGLSGMAYSVLCGQPMAFIAPTGLTLAFISGLFRFCNYQGLPFLPIYTWVGFWTSAFMILLGLRGAGKWIRLCTHFTDEVFNALLSFNFIYEAASSLKRNFKLVADPTNLTMPFASLAMALGTFWSTMQINQISKSIYFNAKVRQNIKDFGPVAVILFMTLLNLSPWFRNIGIPVLTVPKTFELAGGRSFLVDFLSVPLKVRMLCSLPAILLTALFFMDHNISIRLVNKADNKLKKGEAYNLDMVALGIVTGGLSIVGLPWMCGATVQSMNHVRSMTTTAFNEETKQVEVVDVTENRLSGFVVHAMIALTVNLLGVLKYIPVPVFSGLFLFLGRKLMTGNTFLQRVRDSIAERKRLPPDHPVFAVGKVRVSLFTGIQLMCLIGMWMFKQNAATSIFFPSAIGLLMIIRSKVLPRFFTEEELVVLDPTP